MKSIESVLHEHRLFPPPAELAAAAAISGMDAYKTLVAEAEADYKGFWGASRTRDADMEGAFLQSPGRVERAVLHVVRGWRAKRFVQLS